MAFEEVAQFMMKLGVVDVLLPFLLIFTIVLGLLDRTRVLGTEKGKPKTRLNAMVAFVLAFFSIVSLQEIIAIRAFGEVTAVAVIVILVLLMTAGMLGSPIPNKFLVWCGVAICAIGGFVILSRLGILPKNLSDIATATWGPPFAIIVALFAVGWFIFREKAKEDTSKANTEEKPKEKQKKKPSGNPEEEVDEAIKTLHRHGIRLQPPGMGPDRPE